MMESRRKALKATRNVGLNSGGSAVCHRLLRCHTWSRYRTPPPPLGGGMRENLIVRSLRNCRNAGRVRSQYQGFFKSAKDETEEK